ncbi:hypothetical protein WN944_018468 [Citrus x changshan-huyou]|uniref:Uncharacterized protein n=1 Tax=Citrus x changshan-huyou TaxID=2935761 RepID=A0AAP0LU73_9ROSI
MKGWNKSNNTRMNENGQQDDLRNHNQRQRQPISTTETGSEAIQIETGESTVPISKSHVAVELDKQLTLKGKKSMQQPLGCKDQITTAGKKEMLGNVDKEAGGNWREGGNAEDIQKLGSTGLVNKAQATSMKELVKEETGKIMERPKTRRWKHLTIDNCTKDENKMG